MNTKFGSEQEIDRIIEAVSDIPVNPRLIAYSTAILMANTNIIKKIMMTEEGRMTTMEVLKIAGWTDKLEARGEARGQARGQAIGEERKALAIAQNMVSRGYPIEDIVSITSLDPEKVKKLSQ